LSYPTAHALRRFFVCGLLSFGDFLATTIILGEQMPSVAKLMVLQYLVLFIVVHNLKSKQIYDEFKNSYYRTLIFLVEAYIKSTTLATAIHYQMGSTPSVLSGVLALALVFMKCLVTPLIYFLDSFFCVRIPLAQVSYKELVTQLKTALLVGPVLVFAAVVSGEVKTDYFFLSGLSLAKGLANAYFVLLYALESSEYNKYFKL
jgi:hypothetical protein